MSLASVLLYPILLLFPAAGKDGAARRDTAPVEQVSVPGQSDLWPQPETSPLAGDAPFAVNLLPQVMPEDAWQVRIEQRMTIRITPRPSMPLPDMLMPMPGEAAPQFTERKMGNCLPVANIISVRPDRANRLLLFTRDHKVVSAELDRSCRARDFYSGFLMERSDDGRLCVDRDTLLSRSGMSCTLTRMRQLVEQEH